MLKTNIIESILCVCVCVCVSVCMCECVCEKKSEDGWYNIMCVCFIWIGQTSEVGLCSDGNRDFKILINSYHRYYGISPAGPNPERLPDINFWRRKEKLPIIIFNLISGGCLVTTKNFEINR